jgi:hypothetical protein
LKIRTKAPNFGWKSGRTALWRENMMLTYALRSIQFCYANNKQVIDHATLLVQLGINSTRESWQNFQTSLILLIPNSTRRRMITYTNTTLLHIKYFALSFILHIYQKYFETSNNFDKDHVFTLIDKFWKMKQLTNINIHRIWLEYNFWSNSKVTLLQWLQLYHF